MVIIRKIEEMQAEAEKLRFAGKTIGFVPTMGYLHEGHLSLVQIAQKRADVVVMSIFVNPTQFGPGEDFEFYPRDFDRDEQLAQKAGVDIIFYPSKEEMYPAGYLTYVHMEEITQTLCGASRPGHFRGVTTICTKLFHAVRPHFAVFGQKDAQQVAVIQKMVKDLNFNIQIVIGPIVREKNGLAMSSRNVYLSPEERKDALSLNQALRSAEEMVRKGERDSGALVETMRSQIAAKKRTRVDYIEIVHPKTLKPVEKIEDRVLIALAVFVGKTRLIDNTIIELS